ncbi:TIGR04255 family protein [Sphingobium phenoxybenzoativorans]|uniref:TIGR04255 family protein n=1 Tax=Sphingobium phenoxybenzoativorans TaxID=1592790 RepID=A0A975K5I7_9SPHN|nr:TIGR04255 family protein [Sphingobium phenoxybenzoativorans]QUT05191.1 TIGR04255 family protein [Sphingobium phenoxybenzoativorans]
MTARFRLSSPPVNEVAFSAVMGPVNPALLPSYALDLFDVAGTHRFFADRFPGVERQVPVGQMEVAGMLGAPPVLLDEGRGISPRWWFVSEDRSEVLQLQDRFWSYNWRREQPFSSEAYPGFDDISARAISTVETLWKASEAISKQTPVPAGCELMYSNLILMQDDVGNARRISDFLAFYSSTDTINKMGWNLSWNETIGDSEAAMLRFKAGLGGFLHDDSAQVIPVLQLQFVAGRQVSTWEEAFSFYNVAHEYIIKRFNELTTEAAKKEWNA